MNMIERLKELEAVAGDWNLTETLSYEAANYFCFVHHTALPQLLDRLEKLECLLERAKEGKQYTCCMDDALTALENTHG